MRAYKIFDKVDGQLVTMVEKIILPLDGQVTWDYLYNTKKKRKFIFWITRQVVRDTLKKFKYDPITGLPFPGRENYCIRKIEIPDFSQYTFAYRGAMYGYCEEYTILKERV